jgi:hypothetical protein
MRLMTMPSDRYDRWYFRIVAAVFAFICGASAVRYGWYDVANTGSAPVSTQVLCFLFTVAAIAYFVRPRLGHHAMAGLTAIVLLTQAPAGPAGANAFWFFIAAILLLPMLLSRQRSY